MANDSIPLTNVGSGYTVFTQVIPSARPTAGEQNPSQTLSPLRKFLKGEPKALGTVQIMIGVLTILFGIVMWVYPQTISVYSGVTFWGSLLHISAGSLAVSASNKLNSCVVKGAMVMNILSTIAAGMAIILLSLDLAIGPFAGYCNYDCDDYRCGNGNIAVSRTNGITGVLLVFSLLQFTVSIAVSAFTCKATCTNKPPLTIINVAPNLERSVPVVNSFPVHHAQPGVSTLNVVAVSAPPVENPPAYTEKSRAGN